MAAEQTQPDYADGKICYIIIPAIDVDDSASFYEKAVGWKLRRRDDGSVSFDDPVGQVSGMWATGLKPHADSGLRIHIMVEDIDATIKKILAGGGKIVVPVDHEAHEITAEFTDPAGNIFGLYQERALAKG
jgi:predicted enzyme related to lactoylglutathione lyase